MLDPDLPELKVLDYVQTLQRTQNSESRGDLQNKGIYRLVMTVYDWTEKFQANKRLPTFDQLERDLAIEPSKLEYFIAEFAIRTKPPLLKKLNHLTYRQEGVGNPSKPDSYLQLQTVFCRPTSSDGTSCYRYVSGLNEMTIVAVKHWLLEKRIPYSRQEWHDILFSAVDENRLYETYASTELGHLFQCPFDKTKAQKDSTLVLHIKPVLKSLVESRHIFYLRNDQASKLGNKSVFYYFNKEEIFHRLDIYVDYMRKKILPDLVRLGVVAEPKEEDFKDVRELARTVKGFLTENYGDQKTLVEEILLLSDFYYKEMEKVAIEERKKSLDELLKYIRGSGKIVDILNLTVHDEPIDEDMKAQILSDKNLISTEYADSSSYHEYVLHKENIPIAVENARNLYATTKKDTEITILRCMNALDYVDNAAIVQVFEEVENQAYFRYLPFLTWLWRMITGRKMILPHEADSIKKAIRSGLKSRIPTAKVNYQAKLNKARDTLSSSQPQTRSKIQSSRESILGEENPYPGQNKPEVIFESEEDEKWKANLKTILSILDEAWEFGFYPDRVYLMDKLQGSLSEEELVRFLKKKGGKDVYSYMVRNQMEKYPFPILVTRQYLKKNGMKLQEDAESIMREQKAQSMPEQLKFDLAVSLVEFLDRVLPKIK